MPCCHKHLYKNEIPHQAVCIKWFYVLFFIKEKVLISKRILFKKIATTHGKGKFSKIKGSICNISIEVAYICNISPRPTVSNGLIAVKLKRDHVYTEVMYTLNQFVYSLCTRHLIIWNRITIFLKIYLLRVTQVRTCLSCLILLKFEDNLSVSLKKCFWWQRHNQKHKWQK